MNITKGEFKRALRNGNILIVGTKYTSNGWTEFDVYNVKYTPADKTRKVTFYPVRVEEAGYYSKTNYNYKCTASGTDRRLEVILSIGYALGLKFHDIKQNYQWVQS